MRSELRALVLGALFGVVAAVSNLYVSLRTGWSLPVALGFATKDIDGSRSLADVTADVAAHFRLGA